MNHALKDLQYLSVMSTLSFVPNIHWLVHLSNTTTVLKRKTVAVVLVVVVTIPILIVDHNYYVPIDFDVSNLQVFDKSNHWHRTTSTSNSATVHLSKTKLHIHYSLLTYNIYIYIFFYRYILLLHILHPCLTSLSDPSMGQYYHPSCLVWDMPIPRASSTPCSGAAPRTLVANVARLRWRRNSQTKRMGLEESTPARMRH